MGYEKLLRRTQLLVLVLSIMILTVYHQIVLQVASIPSSFWKVFVEIISEREACKVVIKQEIPDVDWFQSSDFVHAHAFHFCKFVSVFYTYLQDTSEYFVAQKEICPCFKNVHGCSGSVARQALAMWHHS